MNRKEYMKLLYSRLAGLPPEERDAAMLYYEEYFEDAGGQNEDKVIDELGNPESLAAQILAENTIRQTKKAKPTARKGLSALWVVILGILALPAALPFILIAMGILIAFACGVFGLLIAIAALTLSLIIGGIIMLGHAIPLLLFNTGGGLFALGASLIAVALGILFLIPLVYLFKAGIMGLINLAGKIFSSISRRIK